MLEKDLQTKQLVKKVEDSEWTFCEMYLTRSGYWKWYQKNVSYPTDTLYKENKLKLV